MTSATPVQCTTNWANKPNGRLWVQIPYRIPHLHPQTIHWVFKLFKIGWFKFCPSGLKCQWVVWGRMLELRINHSFFLHLTYLSNLTELEVNLKTNHLFRLQALQLCSWVSQYSNYLLQGGDTPPPINMTCDPLRGNKVETALSTKQSPAGNGGMPA